MWRLAAVRRLRVGRGLGGPRGRGSCGGSCWSCARPFPAACPSAPRFCPACRALQPPESGADLFRLLGCERTFRLDAAELQRRFRSLQQRLHPDLFSRRPQAERDFSAQHSALVNAAYRTLRSPLSRGLYLLELSGIELAKGTDSEADPDFLSEIMEMNEKLAETDDQATREELENYIAAKQEALTKDVSQAFDQDDLQKAKKVLAKMKYFANLEETVKKKKCYTSEDASHSYWRSVRNYIAKTTAIQPGRSSTTNSVLSIEYESSQDI